MTRKTIRAYGVFDPGVNLRSSRETQAAAEEAARILGGTEWAAAGWTVKPVTVTVVDPDAVIATRHPDMIE